MICVVNVTEISFRILAVLNSTDPQLRYEEMVTDFGLPERFDVLKNSKVCHHFWTCEDISDPKIRTNSCQKSEVKNSDGYTSVQHIFIYFK
jgi:hypothetical protein